MNRFKKKSSRIVLSNKWLKVVREDVINPRNGQNLEFFIVEKPKAVIIVPVDGENIYFIKQYRQTTKRETVELPAGTQNPGESGKQTAKRELIEETGLLSNKITKIGKFFMAPGHSSQVAEVYVAQNLTEVEKELDKGELIGKPFSLTIPEVKNMISDGLIENGPILAALNMFFQSTKSK